MAIAAVPLGLTSLLTHQVHAEAQGGDNCLVSGTKAPNLHPDLYDKTAADSPPQVKRKKMLAPEVVSSDLLDLALAPAASPSLLSPALHPRGPRLPRHLAPSLVTPHCGISLPIKEHI